MRNDIEKRLAALEASKKIADELMHSGTNKPLRVKGGETD